MATRTDVKTETLLELAERCEAATGADDATDWAIAEAIGCAPGLPYTASIDAAMTLVPEGFSLSLHAHDGDSRASVYGGPHALVFHYAATPALALCAAALRAREPGGEAMRP